MPSKQLLFVMERQQQPNWCWTAAATSAGNYLYRGESFAQCSIASICFETNSCCRQPSSCDRPGRLDTALKAVGCFRGMQDTPVSYPEIVRAVRTDMPVGVRIEWNGGGGHFVMVTGYYDDIGAIVIDDPHYGRSIVRFVGFPARHHTGGSWTHSYFLR